MPINIHLPHQVVATYCFEPIIFPDGESLTLRLEILRAEAGFYPKLWQENLYDLELNHPDAPGVSESSFVVDHLTLPGTEDLRCGSPDEVLAEVVRQLKDKFEGGGPEEKLA